MKKRKKRGLLLVEDKITRIKRNQFLNRAIQRLAPIMRANQRSLKPVTTKEMSELIRA